MLFLLLITFGVIVAAVCIAGVSNRLEKIQSLLEQEFYRNHKDLTSLETRLHQVNGTLIEIAALLKGPRPPS